MRIAVLSDIHGNIAALDAVLADIQRRNVDLTVNLGDSLSGPLDAAATADRLLALNLPTVRGNHDRLLYDRPKSEMGLWEAWVIDDLSDAHLNWVKNIPATQEIEGVLLCHGTPQDDGEDWLDYHGPQHRVVPRDLAGVEARLGGATQDLILCGHTHTPHLVRLPSGQTIVNPGTVGCPAFIDIRLDPPVVQQTGAPDARYAVVEQRDGLWQAEHYAVPYDTSEMVKLAKTKEAEGWVTALTTGWTA